MSLRLLLHLLSLLLQLLRQYINVCAAIGQSWSMITKTIFWHKENTEVCPLRGFSAEMQPLLEQLRELYCLLSNLLSVRWCFRCWNCCLGCCCMVFKLLVSSQYIIVPQCESVAGHAPAYQGRVPWRVITKWWTHFRLPGRPLQIYRFCGVSDSSGYSTLQPRPFLAPKSQNCN